MSSTALSQNNSSESAAIPAHAVLLQMLAGKWISSAISAAATLAIADHLEAGPKTIQELAVLAEAQESPLYRLLRALASLGVFIELEDGRFAQTPLSDPLRSSAYPGLRNMAMMFTDDWHVKVWKELPWAVQTGRSGAHKIYGMGGFEWFEKHPEEAVNFNNAMTDMSQAEAPGIAASYDFSRFKTIVDVAGGFGTLLAEVLKKTPGLHGTLFEMPYVIEQARRSPILATFADRCSFEGGSFFESVPVGKDAYIMKYIIHDWDDEKSIHILRNCRNAMKQGSRLLVVDQVVSGRNEPGFAKLMDLEMLVAPGGQERTEPEWRGLYSAAGFRLERIIPTPAPHRIIEGVPA